MRHAKREKCVCASGQVYCPQNPNTPAQKNAHLAIAHVSQLVFQTLRCHPLSAQHARRRGRAGPSFCPYSKVSAMTPAVNRQRSANKTPICESARNRCGSHHGLWLDASRGLWLFPFASRRFAPVATLQEGFGHFQGEKLQHSSCLSRPRAPRPVSKNRSPPSYQTRDLECISAGTSSGPFRPSHWLEAESFQDSPNFGKFSWRSSASGFLPPPPSLPSSDDS